MKDFHVRFIGLLPLLLLTAIFWSCILSSSADAKQSNWVGSNASCATSGCHAISAGSPVAEVAVKPGAAAWETFSSTTAATVSSNVAAGDTIELEWVWTNLNDKKGNTGAAVHIPTGWGISPNTNAGAGGLSLWNGAYQSTTWHGGATPTLVTSDTPGTHDGYVTDYSITPIGGLNTTGLAIDDPGPDGTADRMGAKVSLTVPGGASPGSYTIKVFGSGHVGNSRTSVITTITVTVAAVADTTKPTVTSFTATTPVQSNVNIPITAFTATDNVGVTGYLITESATPPAAGAAGWTGTAPGTYTAAAGDGTKTLYPWAKDAADNVSNVYGSPASVLVDGTDPSTTDNAPAGWQTSNPTVTLTPSDGGSGVTDTQYCIDTTNTCTPGTSGISPQTTIGPGAAGTQYIRYRSTDNAGNVEATQSTGAIQVDRAIPSTTDNAPTGWQAANVTVTLTPTDTGSGVSDTQYCVDTTDTCTPGTSGTSVGVTQGAGTAGTQYVRYRSTDNAGHIEAIQSTGAIQIDKAAPTDGTLTVTPGDSQNGLSWPGAADVGSGLRTANTYDVRFLTGGTPPTCATGTSIYTGTGTSTTHTPISNGTQYSYRVCAYDNVDNVSTGATGSGTPTCAESITSSIIWNGTTSASGDFNGSSFITANDVNSLQYKVTSGSGTGFGQCQVTSGRQAFPSGQSTMTATVSITDTSQAFLLMDIASGSLETDTADHTATGYIQDASTLRFDRYSTVAAPNAWVSYQLVECFNNEISVQRGAITMPAATATNTAPISNVTPANSLVLIYSRNNDTTPSHDMMRSRGTLDNGTTVRATRVNTTGETTSRFEVVEFQPGSGVNLYKGSFAFDSTSAASTTQPIGGTVDPARSWVYGSWDASADGLSQTTVGLELTNATTLTAYRFGTVAAINNIEYTVVEFPNDGSVAVQRGAFDEGAVDPNAGDNNEGAVPITITTPVSSTNKAFTRTYNTTQGTGTAFARNSWIEQLTANNTLTISNWRTNNTNSLGMHYWQVIEFIPGTETTVIDWTADPIPATANLTHGNSYNLYARGTEAECGVDTYYGDPAAGNTSADGTAQGFTWTSGNNPPSLTINQPDGVGDSVTQGASFNIDYDLTDGEDVATVDFYYETDGNGAGGVAIGTCQNQPEGTGATCAWNTAAVTPGNYYVYGVADDTVNATVTVVSSGTLTINAAANNPPSLTINQPDGVSDSVVQGASFNIDYDLSDTEDTATVDFYYETDGNGAGGTAIGTCQNQPEGTGSTCAWDTTAVAPGDYYVYGVADDTVNATVTVVSSGTLTINAAANNPPSLTINQPDGVSDSVVQGASFNIDYDLSDTEDTATVDFYYETDGNGAGGTVIGTCQNQAEGSGSTCAWDTTAVSPGDYYVYGVADDTVNATVTVVSGGTLTITAGAIDTTSAGSASSTVGDTVIDVTAPYTDDSNGNNTMLIEWGLDGVDCSLGSQALPHAASPYTFQITGLTNGQAYQICVTYQDGDGVTGTNPQTLTGLTPLAYNPMIHSSLSTGSTKWGGSWGISGGKYGEFTCTTCHARNTGNIKRVKKTITAPNGTDQFPIEVDGTPPVGGVNFQDVRDGSSDFGDDVNRGGDTTQSENICEVCHSQNQFHNYDVANNTGGTDHANQQDCMTCHPHNQGFKGAGCNGCHGNPPTTADTDGSTSTGMVHIPNPTGATDPANPGAHGMHANTLSMNCNICHTGNTMPTVSNTIQMGVTINNANWAAFGDTVTTATLTVPQDANLTNGFTYVSSSAGTTVSKQNINNPTCTIYCHGDWTGSGGSNTTPAWVGGTAEATCGTCHGATAGNPPTAGSHQTHAGNGAGNLSLACTKCHPSYADTAHLDGDVAWQLETADGLIGGSATYSGSASGTTGGKAPSASYGGCANIYCHSNVQPDGGTGAPTAYATPTWGGTATCGTCHPNPPGMASGSHTKHANASEYGIGCGHCHSLVGDNTVHHADYEVDVVLSGAWGPSATYEYNGTTATIAPGDDYTTCDNVYCHSDGKATLTYSQPLWGATISDCVSCHDDASVGTSLSGAHEAHTVNATASVGKNLGCADCHGATVSNNTTISDKTKHALNKTVDVIDCSANDCHSDGNIGNLSYNNPAWATAIGCDDCHGDGAGKSHPTYANGGTGVNANSHVKHVETASISCGECHADTSTAGTTLDGATPAQHVDQTIDVVLGTGSWNGGTDQCSTTYCHGAGTPTWGGTVNCGDCHAVNNTLPNDHNTHYGVATVGDSASAAKVNNTSVYVYQCGSCHDSVPHGDGNKDVAMDASWGGTINGSLQCSNVYCHSDGAGGAGNVNPTWAVTTMNCGSCHDAEPNTSDHTAHVANATYNFNCTECHNVTTSNGSSIADTFQHVDGGADVDLSGTYDGNGGTSNWNGTSCSAVYCHSDGKASPTYDTVASGSGPVNCTFCHGGAGGSNGGAGNALSGSHTIHTGTNGTTQFAYTCDDCHVQTASNNSTISSYGNHVNKARDVAVAAGNGGTGSIGGDFNGTGCTTTDCHGSNSAGAGDSWAAGGTTGDCSFCHGMAASVTDGRDTNGDTASSDAQVGAHVTHLDNATFTIKDVSCDDCHTDPNNTGGPYMNKVNTAGHMNGTTGMTWSALAQAGGMSPSYSGGSCSSTYCHNPAASSVLNAANAGTTVTPNWTANWDNAGKDAATCGVCHDAPPGTSSYDHSALTIASDCSGCHSHNGRGGSHIDGTLDATASCTGCHGGGTPAAGVDQNSSHVITTVGGSFNACEDCHPGGTQGLMHAKNGDADVVLIANNTDVGINYVNGVGGYSGDNGIVLGGDATVGTTEADICWNCHDDATPDISEWDGSSATYDYGSVTQNNLNWLSTTWSSAQFSYKNGILKNKPTVASPTTGTNNGGSTHAVMGGSAGVDTIGNIGCTYCHDVHNGTDGSVAATKGNPYLRGTWQSNPYREDGAPRSGAGQTIDSGFFGAVPRGDTVNNYGGYQIDQNNGSPALTANDAAGLCELCHGDGGANGQWTTTELGNIGGSAAWVSTGNSHAYVVKGGLTSGGYNLYREGIRLPSSGYAGTSGSDGWRAGRPSMGYKHLNNNTDGYGFRGTDGRSFQEAPAITGAGRPFAQERYAWGATVDDTTTDGGYHQFSCSKCHNPHASRLPKLMITNCLDTKLNTWDDSYVLPGTGTSNGDNTDNISTENANTSTSNWTSAQNCHRLKDSSYSQAGGNGWNTATPW